MSDQKIPQKLKKKSNILKEEDKEKCENYYLEVNKFIEKNEIAITKKINEIDYFFEYDKQNNYFISDHYDHQNLESYGFYNKKEKKIYLGIDEAFYLNQIGLIKFKDEFDFNTFNLVKLNFYSYLRRDGKIPMLCSLLPLIEKIKNKETEENKINNEEIENIDKYFFLFENLNDFKNHKIKLILYQHDFEEKFNYILFQKIINNSKIICDIFKKVNKIEKDSNNSMPGIVICLTQGISMTFIKLNDTIEI